MAVKLVRTEHLGGTAFELFFQIENGEEKNPVDGQIFDVHGLTQMKFFIQNTTDNRYTKVISSVMKHDFTMGICVEMKVICRSPQFEYKFTCSETWSQLNTLYKQSYAAKIEFILEVYFDISSCKSVLDIMYMDEDFTDFQLSTTEGSVAVHRACLAAHSDVFKRMLCGKWKETTAGRIEIQGVTLRTLQSLKQYMYLRTLPEEGLRPLLLIGAYYLIDDLKVECIIKLAHSITSDNLYDVLEFSCVNNIPELTFAILKTVQAQPRDVISAAQKIMFKPNKQKSEHVIENDDDLVLKLEAK